MINVSSEFRDKLNNGNCNYLSYADITLKDGTTLNLTNDVYGMVELRLKMQFQAELLKSDQLLSINVRLL